MIEAGVEWLFPPVNLLDSLEKSIKILRLLLCLDLQNHRGISSHGLSFWSWHLFWPVVFKKICPDCMSLPENAAYHLLETLLLNSDAAVKKHSSVNIPFVCLA